MECARAEDGNSPAPNLPQIQLVILQHRQREYWYHFHISAKGYKSYVLVYPLGNGYRSILEYPLA